MSDTNFKLGFALGAADEPKRVYGRMTKAWIEQQFLESGDNQVFCVTIYPRFNEKQFLDRMQGSTSPSIKEALLVEQQWKSIVYLNSGDDYEKLLADDLLVGELYTNIRSAIINCEGQEIKTGKFFECQMTKANIFKLAPLSCVEYTQVNGMPNRVNPLDEIVSGMKQAQWQDILDHSIGPKDPDVSPIEPRP